MVSATGLAEWCIFRFCQKCHFLAVIMHSFLPQLVYVVPGARRYIALKIWAGYVVQFWNRLFFCQHRNTTNRRESSRTACQKKLALLVHIWQLPDFKKWVSGLTSIMQWKQCTTFEQRAATSERQQPKFGLDLIELTHALTPMQIVNI